MVNFVEFLFGLAIGSGLFAVFLLLRRRRSSARRAGGLAAVLACLAVAGEILLRVVG